jgi:proline iminopeptidase
MSTCSSLSLFMILASVPSVAGHAAGEREGFVEVEGGRVWYRIAGGGPGTPLLLLHGGPGIPSAYLEPLGALGDQRPVVFYDQLGCGHSPAEGDAELWTVGRFVRELARLREALGLDEVHLFGHSWGSMLAMAYLQEHPRGVRSLVLAGPALSAPRWAADARELLGTLPADVQETIATHEEAGTTQSEEYQAAMMEYYTRYVARRQPWSPDLQRAFETMNAEVYETMWGPSEFTSTGILRDFDCTDRLGDLRMPTLVIGGQYDEAPPRTVLYYQDLIPGAELAILPGVAHVAWHDDPQAFVAVLRGFLDRVEGATGK